MHIGDRIRFLNQTGGGVIVGFDPQGRVLVEDEEGFEIPVPRKECVVVEENAVGGTTDHPDGRPASQTQYGQKKTIQTKDGDKLHIALVYTRTETDSDAKILSGAVSRQESSPEEFECILVNEDNYHLLITYFNRNENGYFTRFAGEALPFERKSLFKFGKKELNDFSKKVLLRILPFKREQEAGLKPVLEAEFMLDPVNLLKENFFKENEYISGKGYVVEIAGGEKEEERSGHLSAKDEELKRELLKKFNTDAGNAGQHASRRNRKGGIAGADPETGDGMTPAGFRSKGPGIIEVDLHAGQLLETTAGMSNADILKYQLEKFNEAMLAHLHRRGTKIVFIHGKGDGVLRAAVLKELKSKYSRCTWQDASFKEYGFGATLVTIR